MESVKEGTMREKPFGEINFSKKKRVKKLPTGIFCSLPAAAIVGLKNLYRLTQGVTKRCRLSWLTNSAFVYELKCGCRVGIAGSHLMSAAVHRSPNKL